MSTDNKTLHRALWGAQIFLGAVFLMGGLLKLGADPADLVEKGMAWAGRKSPGLVKFIGASEALGAIGLILPSALRIQPKISGVAAVGLATVMVLAAGEHLTNGEAPFVVLNAFLGGLAAFVAWGRLVAAPIAPK